MTATVFFPFTLIISPRRKLAILGTYLREQPSLSLRLEWPYLGAGDGLFAEAAFKATSILPSHIQLLLSAR